MRPTERPSPVWTLLLLAPLLLLGCEQAGDNRPFDQRAFEEYEAAGRADRYFELREEWGNRAVIFINRETDRWWIVNATVWAITAVLDLPEVAGASAVLAVFYGVALALGGLASGGAFLAVLAKIGLVVGHPLSWFGISVPAVVAGLIALFTVGFAVARLVPALWWY